MSITELYIGHDGTPFTIVKLQQTPFIRYKRLPQNDIEELKLLCTHSKGKSKASSLAGEPAADFGARTTTVDDTYGDNSLQNDYRVRD
jgi:hypothetical protein